MGGSCHSRKDIIMVNAEADNTENSRPPPPPPTRYGRRHRRQPGKWEALAASVGERVRRW